jgi:hypothetical protein
MGETSGWSAQTLHESVTFENDGIVVKLAAIGPNYINNRFEIWHHQFENGSETSQLVTTRSTEKRARRYLARNAKGYVRAGWTTIEEAAK